MRLSRTISLCASMLAAAAAPTVVHAQAGAEQPEAGGMGDIVVTAQKRAQSVQTVPIAITALSASDLAERSATNVTDIAAISPNVMMTTSAQGGSNAGFFIRGIGQFDFISTVDPGVGVYLDGVYIARTAGAALALIDIDRVEVLRGPQGTLFGKNAVGGAISVYLQKPDPTRWSGKAVGRVGEHGRLDFGAAINIPLVADALALRLSGLMENQDGYGRSLFDGRRMNGTHRQVGHAALRWEASDGFSVELAGDYTHVNQQEKMATITAINPASFVTTPQNAFAVANGIDPYDSRYLSSGYRNYAGFHPGDHENIWGTRLTLDWDLGGASLRSITAYRRLAVDTGLDYDGSPDALGDQTVSDRQKQFSQELTLTGKLLDDRIDYALGLFHIEEKGLNEIFLPLSFRDNPDGYDTFTTNRYRNRSSAAYGQGTVQVTDAFSLTAGARFSHERKDNRISTFATKAGLFLLPPTDQRDTWDAFTWRLAAQYEAGSNLMIYGSAATGFKSGGFNGRAQSAGAFLSFDPEKALTFEAGVKTRLFDRRLVFNAAVFQTNYKDIQTTLNVIDPNTLLTVNVVGNPADARIRGVEVEGRLSLGRSFLVDFSAGYLDAKYRNIAAGADIQKAFRLPDTPKWTANVGAQYNLALPISRIDDGTLSMRADLNYRSSVYYNAQNSIYNYQEGYALVNTRLSYGSSNDGWSVAFYGKNIFDKRYASHKQDLLRFVYALDLPGRPRELGIELTKSF